MSEGGEVKNGNDENPFRKFMQMFEDLPAFIDVREVVSYIVKKIRESVEYDGFFDVLIQGQQGLGKSTLALYILYRFYNFLPDLVLDNVFFDVRDLLDVLLKERRLAVLLDDAGISLMKWRAFDEIALKYYMIQQLARTRLKAVIYTTVHDNLARFLREIADVVVTPYDRNGNVVYGRVYRRKTYVTTVTFKIYRYVMDLDEMHSDPVFHELYARYNELRERFVKSVLSGIMTDLEGEKKSKTIALYTELFKKRLGELSRMYGGVEKIPGIIDRGDKVYVKTTVVQLMNLGIDLKTLSQYLGVEYKKVSDSTTSYVVIVIPKNKLHEWITEADRSTGITSTT